MHHIMNGAIQVNFIQLSIPPQKKRQKLFFLIGSRPEAEAAAVRLLAITYDRTYIKALQCDAIHFTLPRTNRHSAVGI